MCVFAHYPLADFRPPEISKNPVFTRVRGLRPHLSMQEARKREYHHLSWFAALKAPHAGLSHRA